MANIEKKLRELRALKGLTQKAIADKLGIIVKDYRRYEQGKIELKDIPSEHVEKIINFYEIDMEHLIEGRVGRTLKFVRTQFKLFFIDNKGPIFGIPTAFVLIVAVLSIFIDIPPMFNSDKKTDQAVKTEKLDYFISIAVSDTISDNFEPTKKIVATASVDTTNMTISSKSSTESYGPFNMTMESERRFIFLAVFEKPGTYIVTITAYTPDGDSISKEITIEI